MNKLIFLLLIWLQPMMPYCQDETPTKEIGVYFNGYLGLMPGVLVDYKLKSWPIGDSNMRSINLRPAIGYNYLLKYAHNYQALVIGTLDQRFFKAEKDHRALSAELRLSLGYQRVVFFGETYEVNGDSFDESQAGGLNALVLGGGLGLNGNIIRDKLLWHFSINYLNEISKGPRGLHHGYFQLGTKIKL